MKIFFFFLIPILSFGQVSYRGTVVNKSTKEKIPFATVAMIKQNIGTNADEEGRFSFTANTSAGDSLIVSCIGFKTEKIPIDKLSLDTSIELEEKQNNLDGIIITDKNNWTFKILNEINRCGNIYVNAGSYMSQLAQHFYNPVENSILTEVNICRFSIAIIESEKAIFRIRIYNMDSITKGPATDLCDSVIEVKTAGRHVTVNLEKYKINIPGKDFFIAIEWLKIPYNEKISKVKTGGKEKTFISYSPSIAWSHPALAVNGMNRMEKSAEIWELNYKGQWAPRYVLDKSTVLKISAKIKY